MFPLQAFESHLSERILRRGTDYFERGSVGSLRLDAGGYAFRVLGSYEYQVLVRLDTQKQVTAWRCSCPYDRGPICKHVVAGLFAIREFEASGAASAARKTLAKRIKRLRKTLKKTKKSALIKRLVGLAGEDDDFLRILEFCLDVEARPLAFKSTLPQGKSLDELEREWQRIVTMPERLIRSGSDVGDPLAQLFRDAQAADVSAEDGLDFVLELFTCEQDLYDLTSYVEDFGYVYEDEGLKAIEHFADHLDPKQVEDMIRDALEVFEGYAAEAVLRNYLSGD